MDLLHPDLGTLGAGTVYLVVIGFVFVESGLLLGVLLPGDSLLFTAGLLSAAPDSRIALRWLVLGVVVAAVVGDGVGYTTGYRLGRPWLERRTSRGRLNPSHLARAERFYDRYGWAAVVIARFIPWVRTLTPILAGASRMPYPRFLSANAAGALLWGAGLVVLGHYAATIPWLRTLSLVVAGTFIVLSLVMAVLAALRSRQRGGSRRTTGRGTDAQAPAENGSGR